jgi:hypothetical protein
VLVGAANALAQKKNASAVAMGVIGNMNGLLEVLTIDTVNLRIDRCNDLPTGKTA